MVKSTSSGHPLCKEAKKKQSGRYRELPLTALKDERFAFLHKESTIYEYIKQLFRDAGFSPNILFETARGSTILEMVSANLCCSIIPYWDSVTEIPDVSYFYLDTHPTWNMMASYKKGSYLSEPAQYFIHLATEFWNTQSYHS